jgi:hypothetical protein
MDTKALLSNGASQNIFGLLFHRDSYFCTDFDLFVFLWKAWQTDERGHG